MQRPEHAPISDPCILCNVQASRHRQRAPRRDRRERPEHPPSGDPCGECGAAAKAHRKRPSNRDRIFGLDGEGIERAPHRYVYLAASDANGEVVDAYNRQGLSTRECLDLILQLPKRCLAVGYSFGYDLTKILQDVPNEILFRLYREQERAVLIKGRVIYKPEKWEGYTLNYMNRRFTVGREDEGTRTIWDFFKFFQSTFVRALTDWKIATADELEAMQAMKAKRAQFSADEMERIKAYCRDECVKLAKLASALITAHDDAGLSLKRYNGPGSTASVLLERMGVKEKRATPPDEMRVPIASAFFGGRFENAVRGAVREDVYAYDLASAYPYAATGLPCLTCGSWRHVKRPSRRTIERAALALVSWSGGQTAGPWGCLPMRAPNVKVLDGRVLGGSIVFPLAGDGGWGWRNEFLAALDFGGQLQAREAWVYDQNCDCPLPFASLAETYRERIRWGKDGPGLALKLAINSWYGKTAQSAGLNPPFQDWVIAGNITSDTRAELLRAVLAAPKRSDVLMMATDGIYSRVPLQLRKPRDTGTSDLKKPLGMWEEKIVKGGIFAVRPGIYFPLDLSQVDCKRPDEHHTKGNCQRCAVEEMRGRGIGRAMLIERREIIMRALEAGNDSIDLPDLTRFVGAKSALHKHTDGTVTRSANYGEWVPHPMRVSFGAHPKRDCVGARGSLLPWQHAAWESAPYDNATKSPEALAAIEFEDVRYEQPSGDFISLAESDYQ